MFDNNYICQPKGIPLVSFYKEFKTNHNVKIFTHMHYHSDFEIIYIKHGQAKMIINENEIMAGDNSILLINPYETHYGEILSNSFSYYCIDFDIKMLSLENEKKILNSRLKYTNHLCGKVFENYISKICNAFEDGNIGWKLLAKGNLLILFSLIENDVIYPESQKNLFSKSVIDYIEDHFYETISSQNASNALGYNQSYFCRIFKKQFQMSFGDYLNIYRVNKAI